MKRKPNLVSGSPRSLNDMHFRNLGFMSCWKQIVVLKQAVVFEVSLRDGTLMGSYLAVITKDCSFVLFVDLDRGKSVTNNIERLVASAVNTFGLNIHATWWLETYGLNSHNRTIDRVYFHEAKHHPCFGIQVNGVRWMPGYALKPHGAYLPLDLLHEGLSSIFDAGGEIHLPLSP